MSTKRRESAKHIRDPEGGYFCSCGCGRKPGKGRLYWHSAECVERWREINDPAYIRQQLRRRDKGICAACGCDAEKEYRQWTEARREVSNLASWLIASERNNRDWDEKGRKWTFRPRTACDLKSVIAFREDLMRRYGPAGKWTAGRQTAWDADHIVEVVRGGGLCGLENYQTLCHPCHKAKTARLARERAEARRAQQQGHDLFSNVPQNTTKCR
jgi:5-methylcytosine-specific restriction endonuclease McrA